MTDSEKKYQKLILEMQKTTFEAWVNADDPTDKKKMRSRLDLVRKASEQISQQAYLLLEGDIKTEYQVGAEDAMLRAQALATKEGLGLKTDFNQQVHRQAVQELLIDTGADLQAAFRTAQLYGIDNIQNIVDNVNQEMSKSLVTGSPRKEIQKAIQREFAQHGLTSFVTKDGKRLPLDFYAQTVARTKRKQANVQGAVNRYVENGIEYVRILGHAPSCEKCSAHFGVIIQIAGEKVAGVPHISDTQLPPFHPNCRCSIAPVASIDGLEINQVAEKDNRTPSQKKAYEAEQGIRQKANQESKLYEKMKAEGVEVPKTLGAFRRLKRKNNEAWHNLQTQYRKSIENAVKRQGGKYDTPRLMADLDFIKAWREGIKENSNANEPQYTEVSREYLVEEGVPFEYAKQGEKNGLLVYSVDANGKSHTIRVEPSEIDSVDQILDNMSKMKDMSDFQDMYRFYSQQNLSQYTKDYFETIIDELEAQYLSLESFFRRNGYRYGLTKEKADEIGNYLNSFDIHTLTPDQERAVKLYTDSEYRRINGYLRGLREKEHGVDFSIEHLDKIFEQSVVQDNVMVFRGSGKEIFEESVYERAKQDPSFLIGTKITDKGYMSTSVSIGDSFGGQIQFQIQLKKGQKGAFYLDPISSMQGEMEVLLKRNTTLKVLDVKTDGYKIKILCEMED